MVFFVFIVFALFGSATLLSLLEINVLALSDAYLCHIHKNAICRFVWRKKIERDVGQGVPIDTFSVKAEKKRQRERMVCIFLSPPPPTTTTQKKKITIL